MDLNISGPADGGHLSYTAARTADRPETPPTSVDASEAQV